MLTGGAITCLVLPPLQAPDEHSHFLHATAVARGILFPQAAGEHAGYELDQGYIAFTSDESVNRVPFHPAEKFDRAAIDRLNSMRVQRAYKLVPNDTAFYFATGYLPQALGIRLAALISDRVMVHLWGARLLNSLVASLLVFVALLIFPPAAPVFFAVSALPMSLFLINSASQDALLIAFSILFSAFCLRLLCTAPQYLDGQERALHDEPRFWAACALSVVLFLAFGRVPYLALLIIPATILLLADWRRYVVFAGAGSGAVIVVWFAHFAYAREFGSLFVHPGAAIGPQWRGVLAHPLTFLKALGRTMTSSVPDGIVGVLGWLDTPLPWFVYPVAWCVFAFSIAATAFGFLTSKVRSPLMAMPWRGPLLVLSAIVAVGTAALLIGLLTYLHAAPVDAETNVPLQGRYFIELLPALVGLILAPLLSKNLSIEITGWRRAGSAVECTSLLLLLVALIASFTVLQTALLDRYYVG
jgi:uncharacterized membrane protein